MRYLLSVLLVSLSWTEASELEIVQGYAQNKDEACELSIQKAVKKASLEAIVTECQCYRQDSRDWLCYTYYKGVKKD